MPDILLEDLGDTEFLLLHIQHLSLILLVFLIHASFLLLYHVATLVTAWRLLFEVIFGTNQGYFQRMDGFLH